MHEDCNSSVRHINLLSEALGQVLKRAGIIDPEAAPKPVELLAAAEDVLESKADTLNQGRLLIEIVSKFVEEHQVTCSESIYQCDHVNLDLPEFAAKCCDVVGYHGLPEEEE